jgi:hypothetical protein
MPCEAIVNGRGGGGGQGFAHLKFFADMGV